MSEVRIITNNVPRLIIDSYELSESERKEFDYLKWDAIDRGEDSASFFRYRGELYDLGEFLTTSDMPKSSPLRKWHGYQGDSYFSAVVVRYTEDQDHVVVGLYLC